MTTSKTCTQWRRMLVTSWTTAGHSERWVTRQCCRWLEQDDEKRRGRCRSCIDGWTHPENYPAEAPELNHCER